MSNNGIGDTARASDFRRIVSIEENDTTGVHPGTGAEIKHLPSAEGPKQSFHDAQPHAPQVTIAEPKPLQERKVAPSGDNGSGPSPNRTTTFSVDDEDVLTEEWSFPETTVCGSDVWIIQNPCSEPKENDGRQPKE
jgi:hypothetical protein